MVTQKVSWLLSGDLAISLTFGDKKSSLADFNLIDVINILGTLAFALSGIRMASRKEFDIFGAFVLGLVTAIGGGTVRDVLLGKQPFWMTDGSYFLITAIALALTIVFKNKLLGLGKTLFLFDTIGLGLFTVVGINTSIAFGLDPWVCIAMGAITGSFGGVIRDLLLNEVPLLFKKDIYALSCISGGLVYFGGQALGFPQEVLELLSAGSVILLRLLAIRYKIHLPVLREK